MLSLKIFMKYIANIDRFAIFTMVVIFLAYVLPINNAHVHHIVDWISTIGISFIFFFYGLKLSPDKLKKGLRNWKLHILIQVATFLIFPLLILPFYFWADTPQTQIFWLAFLFLAALPSTVSSSVVFVSIAKGNLPAAIFNASISGLIGIAVTPLWMGLFMTSNTTHFDFSAIYLKLFLEILLPVVVGILLQSQLGKYALQYSASLTMFDKSVILLIIYKSFSDAFSQHLLDAVSFKILVCIVIAVLLLFFGMYAITGLLSTFFSFDREDKITAQFCGTKKSLVHGTVFSSILFPATFPIGMLLLPLMLFHSLQLFIIGIIATKKSKELS